ncbi:murein biosynthesis integral membrane protein MurJ [Natranaerobius trueperi]|uniref:Probable lipid II flippase MurJ n=1 Tax=Natranaerobius trueperi TaxID=759412 RepID=A0A226C2T8_9FIRM|nr:murein biosynthesis integral membrane protein MurJ [Natranaerobius trueperi]OWZ84944.1 murein biosynthesis integral membrane protein MurJ [Natranaerobius trueperi]
MKRGQAIKAASTITLVSVLSKMFGFFREMALAREFGATFETDAYLIAIVIPQMLFASIGASIATTFIPLYTEARLDKKQELSTFVGTFFKIMVAVSTAIVGFGLLFTPEIVSVISPGFTGEVRELSILLTRIMLPVIIFLAAGGVLKGILHSHNEFFIPVSVGIYQNIIIMFFILVLGSRFGIEIVSFGTLLGFSMNFFVLLPKAISLKAPLITKLNLSHPFVKRSLYLMAPILFGNMVLQLNKLVDRMLASNLDEGSISALNYASKVYTLPHGIFVMAVATVLYPSFSECVTKKNMYRLKELMITGLSSIVFLVLPMMAGAIVLREPIIRVLFERGQFDTLATQRTAFALLFYSFGMLSISLREILSRVFYSFQDTKTPMRVAMGMVVVNLLFNFLLIGPLGHGGLALATSLSMTAGTTLLFIGVRRLIGPFGFVTFAHNSGRIFLAVLGMIGTMYLTLWIIPDIPIFKLIIPTLTGGTVYLIVSKLLNVEEIGVAKDLFIQVINRFR